MTEEKNRRTFLENIEYRASAGFLCALMCPPSAFSVLDLENARIQKSNQ
jgi:hypothetical protein